MSVRPSVRPSVCPVLFSKVKSTHTRRILCRVSGLVLFITPPPLFSLRPLSLNSLSYHHHRLYHQPPPPLPPCFPFLTTSFYLNLQTDVKCDKLSAPSDGHVDYSQRKFGATASFSCRPGFILKGPKTKRCGGDGKWAPHGQQPLCVRGKVVVVVALVVALVERRRGG